MIVNLEGTVPVRESVVFRLPRQRRRRPALRVISTSPVKNAVGHNPNGAKYSEGSTMSGGNDSDRCWSLSWSARLRLGAG